MTSRLNVVLFVWMLSLKLCCCYNNCDFVESYDEVITVFEEVPVDVAYYKWCPKLPPRCLEVKEELRTIQTNKTVTKTRIVRRCCIDQFQLKNDCIPKSTYDQYPNIQCELKTSKCKCQPGYHGSLCKQRCNVGLWGVDCKNDCHEACADCDLSTGCCNILKNNSEPMTTDGLKLCITNPIAIPETTLANVQTSTTVKVKTQKLVYKSNHKDHTDKVSENNYDELIKKLILITIMAVISIAMVFIIIFVVFFKYYGISKNNKGIRNRWSKLTTSDNIYETCLTTPNSHAIPDICIKNSSMYKSADDDLLSIQHEIFSPVFSAPQYTNFSTLYDSPQPLYEVLH